MRGNKEIRWVELTDEFIEPDWCEKLHIGYVLEGEMEINLSTGHGAIKQVKTGDGVFIPRGKQHRHRHHSTKQPMRLILVEGA